jgi:phenylacetate-CoA ligase
VNQSIAKTLFYGVEWLRREPVKRYLEEMVTTQFAPPERIIELQSERLRGLIAHALKHSPYYQNKYKGLTEEQFEDFPLLRKEELRSESKAMITPGYENLVSLCKTSGSTGVPIKFYRDKVTFARTLGSVFRAHRWYGLDVGAKEAMLWGIPSDRTSRFKARSRDFLLNRFREKEYDLTPEVLDDFYRQVRRKQPDYLFGYSSMVYEFASHCRDNNLPGRELGLKAAICTAETIHPFQRELIQSTFGCPVVSEYGAAETGIISYQCPAGRHHISDDTVLVELLGSDGRSVPEGEIGKVVATVLFSHAAPIIRYDLGDLAIRSSERCPCGVNLSLLDQIVGRTSGIIVTPAGRRFHSIILYYIMKQYADRYGGIRQFYVRQTHPDRLEVHIVTNSLFTDKARSWLSEAFHDKFGDDMQVEFLLQEKLPRTKSGKLTDFESDLNLTAGSGLEMELK